MKEPIILKEQTHFPYGPLDRNNDSPRFEKVSIDMTEEDIKENMLFPSKWNMLQFLVDYKKWINLIIHI